LLFLDIQMPGQSGFDVLRAIPSMKLISRLFFITAYDKYGIQAIKFSALDYLLKPIDVDEFKLAIEKARPKIAGRQQNQSIENLLQYIKGRAKRSAQNCPAYPYRDHVRENYGHRQVRGVKQLHHVLPQQRRAGAGMQNA
jgi:DNA-binding LytR/AlgR family response regulator